MTDPLVQVLSQPSSVSVFMAQVTAVAADGTLSLSVNGGVLPSVTRLRSYTDPAVGDVVLVLTTGQGTTVVLGAEVARPGVPAPVNPPAPLTAAPSLLATYDRKAETWTTGAVQQTALLKAGVMFYTGGQLDALFGRQPASIEVLLRVDSEAQPLGMVLVQNGGPVGPLVPMSPLHVVQPQPGGMWVRLPLSWVGPLVSGAAGGIGFISNTDTAQSVSDGTLRVTPM